MRRGVEMNGFAREFQRRVLATREAEQETALVATDAIDLTRCKFCGRGIADADELERPTGVMCSAKACRRQARDETASETFRLNQRHRRAQLLQLAGFTRGAPMEAVEKQCAKCGKRLRTNNTKGICSGGCTTESSGTAPRVRGDSLKKFRIVAGALGFDPDGVLEEFCAGWLDRVRERAGMGFDSTDTKLD